jgi:WD repeat-containing protein mio
MKFSDPVEQELNLGPLYATAAKSQVPVFGPKSYKNPETAAALNKAIKEAIHSGKDPIIDLMASKDPKDGQASSIDGTGLAEDLAKVRLEAKAAGKKDAEAKAYSSRELHDQSHYSARSHDPASKKDLEKLNNVILQRAMNGYLFDCAKNGAIAAADGDAWLQEAWDWVAGIFKLMFVLQ